MSKNSSLYKDCNINKRCNSLASKNLILVTIFAAIISQEIEDDEELGILATFLIVLGEELALASETRIVCKAKILEEEDELSEGEFEEIEVDNTLNRSISNPSIGSKKVKKKYIKKIKKVHK